MIHFTANYPAWANTQAAYDWIVSQMGQGSAQSFSVNCGPAQARFIRHALGVKWGAVVTCHNPVAEYQSPARPRKGGKK